MMYLFLSASTSHISSLPIKIPHIDHHYNHGMIVLQSQTGTEYKSITWDEFHHEFQTISMQLNNKLYCNIRLYVCWITEMGHNGSFFYVNSWVEANSCADSFSMWPCCEDVLCVVYSTGQWHGVWSIIIPCIWTVLAVARSVTSGEGHAFIAASARANCSATPTRQQQTKTRCKYQLTTLYLLSSCNLFQVWQTR